MVDPKMVELACYNDIPHMLCPSVTDPKKVSAALNWVVSEMESRYTMLSKVGARHIKAYNAKPGVEKLPYIVIIIDEFTGRLMVGRRWSDGLHQAVEAKEGVKIKQESKTLATISFQNYFRMYEILSGMTGTASTEAEEFNKIYNLDVVVVPTNKPMVRKDREDAIFKNLRAKYAAIISEIEDKHKKGQPVLVGTTSIEKNEIINQFLKRKKIPHNILNAKNHEGEATIIADAGKPGAVTVATNMAGRGVDIVLGGSQPEVPPGVEIDDYKKTKDFAKWQEMHDKVIKAGGLHVIGTERHESRRIDNQLRGRSGRQGDPGSTRFFLSLEDDLMRIFGGEQIQSLMTRLKVPDDQPIENKLISRAIEQAQVKVEGHNFDIRKNLVEYDDVANQQREIVYSLRKRVLESKDLKIEVKEKLTHQIDRIILSSQTSPEGGNYNSEKIVVGLLEMIPFDDASRGQIKTQIEKAGSNTRASFRRSSRSRLISSIDSLESPAIVTSDISGCASTRLVIATTS